MQKPVNKNNLNPESLVFKNKFKNNLNPESYTLNPEYYSGVETERFKEVNEVADWLEIEFSSPQFRPVFLKAAWRIPQMDLISFVWTSKKIGKNPRAYFIALVKGHPKYKH